MGITSLNLAPDWLQKLGMSEYAQRFADNDIDFSILCDLTDQDLKNLGVVSLGHRRKMFRAIAELDHLEATAAATGDNRFYKRMVPVADDLCDAPRSMRSERKD